MTKQVAAVVLIALPDSVNPSLIAGDLYQATSPHRVRRTLAFSLTAFAVTLAGGLLVALGLGDVVLRVLPQPSAMLKYALLTAAGVGLITGGIVIWLRRSALTQRELSMAATVGSGGRSAALMGAGIAGVELLTAFPYFAVIAVVVGSSASPQTKFLLLLLYNVVYSLPLFAIVLLCIVLGDRIDPFFKRAQSWILARWPVLVAPLAIAAGAAVTAYAIAQLD